MSLHVDNYDPQPAIDDLADALIGYIGMPMFRLARQELKTFLHHEVGRALREAFSKAEGIYVGEQFKQANESSQNMLRAVFAGAELERRKKK